MQKKACRVGYEKRITIGITILEPGERWLNNPVQPVLISPDVTELA